MVYIVILAILTGMFIGFRRGFLRSVFKLLITILSVVLSYVLAPLIANWVISYTTLDDKLQASIASQMEETARQQVKNQLEASVGQYGITVTDDMVNAALDTQLSDPAKCFCECSRLCSALLLSICSGMLGKNDCAGRRLCADVPRHQSGIISIIYVIVPCTSHGISWRLEPGDGSCVWWGTGVSVYMDGIYHPALCRGYLRRQCIDAADTR